MKKSYNRQALGAPPPGLHCPSVTGGFFLRPQTFGGNFLTKHLIRALEAVLETLLLKFLLCPTSDAGWLQA